MAGPCSLWTAGWCKQRLPRLRRLLCKLSAIGCRVLDRICTRLYLTQIVRRSANGYRTMQFRILARNGVNTYALARRTTASFTLQSFASFWKSPYILSFAYIPSTQSLKAAKPPLRETGAGILLFAKGAPFAQFTKMSAKDGWAMLLWVHSAFRTFGVSCKSVPPSTVAQWNGLCLLRSPAFNQWLPCNAVSHSDPAGWCKRRAPAQWTHSVFRACGVSWQAFCYRLPGA